uniref:Cystatin domain-containing protein n=1 Tax=Hucho hucho TaxID=62062 RepID=A0A4W5LBU3_9TELE
TGSLLAMNVKDATPEVQQICNKMKPHAGKKFDVFTVKTFTTQVVVHVGEDEFMHLCVHKTLPHAGGKLELHRVQTPKTHNDPIGFF